MLLLLLLCLQASERARFGARNPYYHHTAFVYITNRVKPLHRTITRSRQI
ncbi:hypothetical protein CBL_00548 [Carabus blaptoides fortunei]